MKPHDLTITHYDKPVLALSKDLLDRQNAWHNVEALKEAHQLKLIFMEMMSETDDPKELRELGADVELVEFELQRLWGFEEDKNYHRWWNLPKCRCPKMDNDDWYGTKYGVYSKDCPVHAAEESLAEKVRTALEPMVYAYFATYQIRDEEHEQNGKILKAIVEIIADYSEINWKTKPKSLLDLESLMEET